MRRQTGERIQGEMTVNKLTIQSIHNTGYRVNHFTKAFVAAMAVSSLLATSASACAPKANSSSNLGIASPAIQSILAKAHGRIPPDQEIAPTFPQGEPSIVGMWSSAVIAGGH